MAAIRLDCCICPSSPRFSDLSHLLTHLASKGHLSHEFKAKMRSGQDKTFLEEVFKPFEDWKRDNDLEKLLHDRIQQKEKKKNGDRQQAQRQQTAAAKRTASNGSMGLQPNHRAMDVYGPTASIDPLLTAAQHAASTFGLRRSTRKPVKREFSNMATPEEYDNDNLEDGHGDLKYSFVPGYGQALAVHPGIARTQSYHASSKSSSYRGSESPSLQRFQTLKRRGSDASAMTDNTTDRYSTDSLFGQEQEEKVSEYAILKGIRWPGMNLFDSASPHAKRIRNQKKDISTLTAMQTYSETIEPIETIMFYPSWDVKKTREITGQVESSEDESSQPDLKQSRARSKRAKTRQALDQADANKIIRKRSNNADDFAKSPTEDTASTVSSSVDQTETLSHLNGGLPGLWQVGGDEDLDWNLPFESNHHDDRRPKLGVFRDTLSHLGKVQHRHSSHNEDGDIFMTGTPTPKPQLPPLRSLTTARTPTPKPSGTSVLGMDRMAGQTRGGAPAAMFFDRENAEISDGFGMGHGFGQRGDNMEFQDPYGQQRYYSMSSSNQPQFSTNVPQYMDFNVSHQPERLMAPPVTFGNGSYGNYNFGNSPFSASPGLDNPLGLFSSRSPVNQSPTRDTQRTGSMNPLLDMSRFLGDPMHVLGNEHEHGEDRMGMRSHQA